jgi:hypothetical protein
MNRDFGLMYLFFNNTSLSDSQSRNWIVIVSIVDVSHIFI